MNHVPVPSSADIGPLEQDPRTRDRLLQSAVHVFDRKGYFAASVREIAEMAGVTKPALYYHFGSKEGLLLAILEWAVKQFSSTVAAAVERTGSARERLLALSLDVFGLFEEHIPIVRVAHTVFLGPQDLAPAFDVTTFERVWRDALQRVIEDGQRSGEFRQVPSLDIAYALMGLVDSCADRQMHPGCEPIGLDGVNRILNLVLDGVAVRQPA
jgi:AcrR family transcriptional regulator